MMPQTRRIAVFLALAALLGGSAALLREAQAGFVTPPSTLRAPTPGTGAQFGYAAASGDVNDDGYDDVIIGAPRADFDGHASCGEVDVYLSPSLTSATTLHAPEVEDGAFFGWSVAAADVNGDGVDDIIVGEPYATVASYVEAGRAFVFLGPSFTTTMTIDNPEPEIRAHFGFAVSTGDVNHDGRADLLLGSPDATAAGTLGAGKAFVFLAPDFSSVHRLQDPQPEQAASFGMALAAGDVNDDGNADVIVGAPNTDVGFVADAGQTFVFQAPSFNNVTQLQAPEPEAGGFFGRAVASGDFTADGYDDLLIGAYGSHLPYAGDGRAFVFAAPLLSSVTVLVQPVVVADSAYFGYELTAADVNHDGYADAVIGAHDADLTSPLTTGGGEADIFLGPSFQTVIHFQAPQPQTFGYFARSVAVGDVNGDGNGDLIAGAPRTDVGTAVDAGQAFVFLAEPDPDADGLGSASDNCPYVYNPDQLNTDAKPIDISPVPPGQDASVPNSDGLGDACDPDIDNDYMLNTGTNQTLGIPGEDVGCGSGPTNPLLTDSDGDTVVDGYECLVGSNPNDPLSKPPFPSSDSDADGVPDSVEALFGSDPNKIDTDGDGIPDGVEIKGWATSPTLRDTNGNGCDDNIEIADVNGDYAINVGDLLIVAKAAAGMISYNADFDVLRDGRINVGDELLVAKQSGKRCG